MNVKLSRGFIAQGLPTGLRFANPAANKIWPDHSLFNQAWMRHVLTACADWIAVTDLRDQLCSDTLTGERVDALIRELLANDILMADEPGLDGGDSAQRAWADRGWEEAALFHHYSNRLPKTDYARGGYAYDDKLMTKYVDNEPSPSNFKAYGAEYPRVSLPRDAIDASLTAALADPSTRFGGRDPLTLAEFGWFMHLAYGRTGVRRSNTTGAHIGKTSPSGGSRHPTEVYVVVLNVIGLASGLYHFGVETGEITLLAPGLHEDFVRNDLIVLKERPGFHVDVALIYATVFERSMFRYREPRSYRVMNLDIGHLMQTSQLLANSLGLRFYNNYSIRDGRVDSFIGLDGFFEASMACAALGRGMS